MKDSGIITPHPIRRTGGFIARLLITVSGVVSLVGCQEKAKQESARGSESEAPMLPLSDPGNAGGWVLNTEVSDEFEGEAVDEERWFIVGKFEDGKPVYLDPDRPERKVWKGRAPSQFSGRNYRLEEGKLILETRWEPDFPFSVEPQKAQGEFKVAEKYENITTACFIGRKEFKYGYLEIKSKAADAEVTSSFWATGNGSELDIFEQFGDHRQPQKAHLDQEFWWSIHDWSREGKGRSTFTEHLDYGFRVADDFHVYGFEWDAAGVKSYVDGKMVTQATREEVDAWAKEKHGAEKGYVITDPVRIWLDQETFPWHGVPDSKEDLELNSPEGEKEDGVVDFAIEYVRVWQKAPAS